MLDLSNGSGSLVAAGGEPQLDLEIASQITTKPGASPSEALVAAVLERSRADLGWIVWQDEHDPIVIQRDAGSALLAETISEFPDPPENALVIEDSQFGSGPWATWCMARGIGSCVVFPVRTQGYATATVGLAGWMGGSLGYDVVERLRLVSSVAAHARSSEIRLDSLGRSFDEVTRTLESALALDRALRLPPTYREIARSVGDSLDATYCQIAIQDGQAIAIRAAGGHRPPRRALNVEWPLAQLPRCEEAVHERRAVVLAFHRHQSETEPERLALFTPTTRSGVLLPFFAGPRTEGVLIIGEERRSRCQPLSPERVAILELIASRLGHIVQISRRLEYERLAERRRQRRLTAERQRLAREVHDEVGQTLSALLVQLRYARAKGQAGEDQLEAMELAARGAVDGARALAYSLRSLERGIGPLEEAHRFAESMLRTAQCRLSWVEDRADVKISQKALRQIASVIKESVNNTVRHAKASEVRVRIQYPENWMRVSIKDNGIGFSRGPMTVTSQGRGLGLLGNTERLAEVGGSFEVRNSRNGGTMVLIQVPR